MNREHVQENEGDEDLNRKNEHNLYTKNTLETKLMLDPTQIGEGITMNCIQNTLINHLEGRCISAGYVQPKSVRVISYSAGLLKNKGVEFNVVFECRTCNPVMGSIFYNCKCVDVSKAGIKAYLFDGNGNRPVSVLINRELVGTNGSNSSVEAFNRIKVGNLFHMKTIGSHFELNDEYVVIIGTLYFKNI